VEKKYSGQPRNLGSIPGKMKLFLLAPQLPNQVSDLPSCLSILAKVRTGHHLPSYGEVKNDVIQVRQANFLFHMAFHIQKRKLASRTCSLIPTLPLRYAKLIKYRDSFTITVVRSKYFCEFSIRCVDVNVLSM
jgi:hypothetical protein